MAIFCGGLAQLLAGMWEFPRGNVFGGTGEYLSPTAATSALIISSLHLIRRFLDVVCDYPDPLVWHHLGIPSVPQ